MRGEKKHVTVCLMLALFVVQTGRRLGRQRPPTHLQGTVDHADDVVELLMVQYGAVLLDVETELVGETLASGFAFERAEGSWQRLPKRRDGGREGETLPTLPTN